MSTAYIVATVMTIAATLGSVIADVARVRSVLANAAEVGVPQSWLPTLAALKAAGAAGLLLGLSGVPLIGAAAAVGLVLFFLGAVAAHLRARVYHNIAFPLCFLVLAIACLAVSVAR